MDRKISSDVKNRNNEGMLEFNQQEGWLRNQKGLEREPWVGDKDGEYQENKVCVYVRDKER